MERLGKSAVPGFPMCWLAFCVMIGGLWWRSYGRADVGFAYLWGGRVQTISSAKGSVGISISNLACGTGRAFTVDWAGSDLVEWDHLEQQGNVFPVAKHGSDLAALRLSRWEGILYWPGTEHRWWRLSYTTIGRSQSPPLPKAELRDGADVPGAWQWSLAVPYWLLPALAGVPFLRSMARWGRARRWQRHGCCVRCGYDLRATPVRCPECGGKVGETVPAAKAQRGWPLRAFVIGGTITAMYGCAAWLGWIGGGSDDAKVAGTKVTIRMYDVSDLAPPLEKRDDQVRVQNQWVLLPSRGGGGPRFFRQWSMIPLGAERGWRVVDNNVAAIELSAMMHEFAKSWQDSPVLGYSYGGRLVVVGSAETQRRASSVLQFIREQTAAGADNAMGGTQ